MEESQSEKGEIKSLKKAMEEGEVQKIQDICPKCHRQTLVTDDDMIWCINKDCDYEWWI